MIEIIFNGKSERIDKFLAGVLDYSRSEIAESIKNGNIMVNGQEVKASYKLVNNDKIQGYVEEKRIDLSPVDMELDIIYEDEDFIGINKPYGLVVHPSLSTKEATLVNGLIAYTNQLSDLAGKDRPGIVHRLDKDTTGAIVVCKNNESHKYLARLFKERKVKKTYLAIVHGKLDPYGEIDVAISRNMNNRTKMKADPNGKRNALSYYWALDSNENYSLAKIEIVTGRTHQIRVHMDHIGHQILGDEVYGRKKEKVRVGHQMLHSLSLSFEHPKNHEKISIYARPDEEFYRALEKTGLEFK